ncbi:hypothetical protein SDC9_144136 [bioreactor metagenome]|uniref:Uncharacterized protein n=1 Tax=bioreactor metagenome TaxID=1076179 RepID=A0A645E608_9ZZZZ
MVVEHCGKQVVGRADCVEVAGEVEVDVLHGYDLGVAASGRAALDAEHGAERWLAQGEHDVLAYLLEPIGKADAGGRLALSGGGGVDGRNEYQLAALRFAAKSGDIQLCLVFAVILEKIFVNPGAESYLADWKHFAFLRYLYV